MNGWWAGIGLPSSLERLEQREVDDPQEAAGRPRDRGAAELEAQQAEHVPDLRALVGDEQDEVAGLGADGLDQAGQLGLGEELGDGRVELAAVLDPHPHQALGARALGLVGEVVELRERVCVAAADDADALHARRLEGVELGVGEHRR